MGWPLPHRLPGLCIVLLAACADGGASLPDGSTTPDGGTGGSAGTGGVQGTGGGAGAGVQGTGGGAGTGVQGTGGGAGGVRGTGGGAAGASSTGGAMGTGGGAGGTALSFAADIWPVIDQVRNPVFVYRGAGSYEGCTAASPCHGTSPFGARLSMVDSNAAYAAFVNVASITSLCAAAGATVRVVPGDPDRSCLVQFYVGRLKDDLQWVGQPEIDLVRRWIAEGARP
jgi:hypothetical protein